MMLGAISMMFPEKGFYITESYSIHYPTVHSLFGSKKEAKKDISAIIALADAEEKVTENNNEAAEITAIELKDTAIKLNTSIQYKNATKSAMANFFNSLANINKEEKKYTYSALWRFANRRRSYQRLFETKITKPIWR